MVSEVILKFFHVFVFTSTLLVVAFRFLSGTFTFHPARNHITREYPAAIPHVHFLVFLPFPQLRHRINGHRLAISQTCDALYGSSGETPLSGK